MITTEYRINGIHGKIESDLRGTFQFLKALADTKEKVSILRDGFWIDLL